MRIDGECDDRNRSEKPRGESAKEQASPIHSLLVKTAALDAAEQRERGRFEIRS